MPNQVCASVVVKFSSDTEHAHNTLMSLYIVAICNHNVSSIYIHKPDVNVSVSFEVLAYSSINLPIIPIRSLPVILIPSRPLY